MRGGHFASYSNQEASMIRILDARACTFDRRGSTGTPSLGQLHIVDGDQGKAYLPYYQTDADLPRHRS